MPAHFSAPPLEWEHQLNPPPQCLAAVSHPHSPSPGWVIWGLAARDRWVSTVSGSVAFGGCWHLGVARALPAAALAPCKALGPACAAMAAPSHLSLAGTCSDPDLGKGVQEMLPEVPGKWHEPEPSPPSKTGGKLQPPSPPATALHLNRQPPGMQLFNSQFLPVPKHAHSQWPAGQRDPSKDTLISERLG